MTPATQLAFEIAFFTCTSLVAAPYLFYPLGLLLLTPFRRSHRMADHTPPVTLVISAFNEEAVIREKLENSLELDYPAENLEIMVVSDASDDATDAIVASFADRGVVLHRQQPRQGKSAGLTRALPEVRGELIVFSDANSLYKPDAIRKLVRHFADPRVGYAVGHQRYMDDPAEVSVAESTYWTFEVWLKEQESRLGSVVGGDGAIYAIRRELFEPLRDDDISDFVLPLKIVARGFRGIFDKEAVCYERTAVEFASEFHRKTRIVNRSFGAVLRLPAAMNRFRLGPFSIQLLLHKVLRWFVPFFLIGALASTCALAAAGNRLYFTLTVVQLAFYLLASLRAVPGLARLKPVYFAYYFCLVNAASALGILQRLCGKRIATWTPHRTQVRPEPATTRGTEID